ncbi:hypothetical protein [Rubinisphaera margarita]|uniref:hypothetical protein n=1 Tax=Rubinisphaera margarita TaxID=2909586 RepID=UPI001EE87B85|nr:hypothetical protein [Rubinisphaera margarita]MCG6156351.1 hypothetical protein [Rubinisphaera margarita]
MSPQSSCRDVVHDPGGPSIKRLLVTGAAIGLSVSLIVPVAIAAALQLIPAWVENVTLVDQLAYFGANYFLPSTVSVTAGLAVSTVMSNTVSQIRDTLNARGWRGVVLGAILTGGGFAFVIISFIHFSAPQGFMYMEHLFLSFMAYPNAIVSGIVAGQYVNRRLDRIAK